MRWSARRSLLAMFAALVMLGTTQPAAATMSASRDADALGAAIAAKPAQVSDAALFPVPPNGNPAAIGPVFGSLVPPLDGETMSAVSTGDAVVGGTPSTQDSSPSNDNGGSGARPAGTLGSAVLDDLTTLTLTLKRPATANCLAVGVDFFTDEVPYADDGQPASGKYVDGFIADDGSSSWFIDQTSHSPTSGDFATFVGQLLDGGIMTQDFGHSVYSSNAQNAGGTPYNAASGWFYAMEPVPAHRHVRVDLSVFDRGDATADSTALLDDLRFLRRQKGSCPPGLMGSGVDLEPPPAPKVSVAAKPTAQTAKVKFADPEGDEVDFACVVDSKRFKPCDSPLSLKHLAAGRHRVAVHEVDAEGNEGPDTAKSFHI